MNDLANPRSSRQKLFRILLGAFMLLAGVGHLSFQREAFQAQVPQWLPSEPAFVDFVVISSGVVEIILGLAMLFWTRQQAKVGLLLALFFVLIFPGNIAQYVNGTDAFGLDSDLKRLIRLFFQPVLIIWALWSTSALELFKNKRTKKSS